LIEIVRRFAQVSAQTNVDFERDGGLFFLVEVGKRDDTMWNEIKAVFQ
jgi:hypothetical protein